MKTHAARARQIISRRQALERIGLAGAGLGVLGSLGSLASSAGLTGCSLGPNICSAPPPDVMPATARDAAAHAMLSHLDTFVVVMLENRSFDHLLGGLKMDSAYAEAKRIAGITGDETNLDSDGNLVRMTRLAGDGRGTMNPAHDWRSAEMAFDGGRNDCFVIANASKGPGRDEVMSYLGRDQVPFFHALADRYTVFDRWFSSFMGQTWPNRYFLHATTSNGRRENLPLGLDAPIGIWERMAQRCCSARNYAAGNILWYAAAFPTRLLSGQSALVPGTIEDFFRDARAGNLPNLSVIDPDFKVNDAYPMHSPAPCEAFVASIVKALADSPQWSRSLLLVTFDEHGGYYDHIAPPETVDLRPDFRQLGFRVPAFAIGPTVRAGAVVSTQLEHVSIAATMRARFGIESLSQRMDATLDVSDCIDPALIGAPTAPPSNLAAVELTPAVVASLTSATTSQPELDDAAKAGGLPSDAVDPRSDDERVSSWLRYAQDLDAVKVRG